MNILHTQGFSVDHLYWIKQGAQSAPGNRYVSAVENLLLGFYNATKPNSRLDGHFYFEHNEQRLNYLSFPSCNKPLHFCGQRVNKCEKPEQLMSYIIKHHSKTQDTILDLMSGSGSGIDAALKLGRNCCAIEKDEQQVKAIQARIAESLNTILTLAYEKSNMNSKCASSILAPAGSSSFKVANSKVVENSGSETTSADATPDHRAADLHNSQTQAQFDSQDVSGPDTSQDLGPPLELSTCSYCGGDGAMKCTHCQRLGIHPGCAVKAGFVSEELAHEGLVICSMACRDEVVFEDANNSFDV
jgi:hypothetical protein